MSFRRYHIPLDAKQREYYQKVGQRPLDNFSDDPDPDDRTPGTNLR